jgi:hypothetical protein
MILRMGDYDTTTVSARRGMALAVGDRIVFHRLELNPSRRQETLRWIVTNRLCKFSAEPPTKPLT